MGQGFKSGSLYELLYVPAKARATAVGLAVRLLWSLALRRRMESDLLFSCAMRLMTSSVFVVCFDFGYSGSILL
jgi:hypothetical protein